MTNDTILIAVDDKFRILNKTESPDQFLSVVAMLANNMCKLLETYSGPETEDLNYDEVKGMLDKAITMYKLVDSGMDDKEAADVLGINAHAQEIDYGED